MSRIGKQPIVVPSDADISINDNVVQVKGPKGMLTQPMLPGIDFSVADGECVVTRESDQKQQKQLQGLFRQLLQNMVIGVTKGFEKRLQIIGVGYRAELKGETVIFSLGYSMPIEYVVPKDVSISVEKKQDFLTVSGINKQRVGQVSAEIRSLRPPEPYKGKGIRYVGEEVRRKEGKSGVKK